MNEQLEPCPYCGQKAEAGKLYWSYYVRCPNPRCRLHTKTITYKTEKEAHEKWNRRAKE